MPTYMIARTVEEAVAAMASGALPVAGGTDLVVGARQGKKPLPDALVGIHRIAGLDRIVEIDGGLEIGALVTHRAIVEHPLIRTRFTALADASAIIGSHATRANGTLGGNLMNASPALDTGAPLLTLGALAQLVGPEGARTVDLADLWTGPGTTAAQADELLVSVRIPAPAAGTGSAYVRLQYRRQMEIAVVGAGVVITLTGGRITSSRVAITALAPTIRRVPQAEAALLGSTADNTAMHAASEAAAAAQPIDDVRASADYRRAMAAVITERAIRAALARAEGHEVPIPATESTHGT